MKLLISALILFSFSAKASPEFMSMKDRLRLHMWVYGLEMEQPVKKVKSDKKALPEEIERPLRKI